MMEATYRGIKFEAHPAPVVVSPGKVGGRYRGLSWQFRHLQAPLILKPTLDFIYRGITVHAHQPAVTVQPNATDVMARTLMLSQELAERNRQQSMLMRSAKEVGLEPEAALHWHGI